MRKLWKNSSILDRAVVVLVVLILASFSSATFIGHQWREVPLSAIGYQVDQLPCKRMDKDPDPVVTAMGMQNGILRSTQISLHVRVHGVAPTGVTWSTGTEDSVSDLKMSPQNGEAVTAYVPDGQGGQVSCTVIMRRL